MRPTRSPRLVAAALCALAVLAAAGCGAAPEASSAAPAESAATGGRTSYPLTFDNCGTKVTFREPPRRVLILNGTSVGEVESFVLLGLEKSILANAQHYGVSDDPSMIARIGALPTGGLTMNKNFDVPAEQVLKLKPDLVVSTWSGGFDAKRGFATREQLAAAGITSLVNPVNCAMGKPEATPEEQRAYRNQSINSSLEFIGLLGRVFDVQERALRLIGELRARVEAVRARVAGRPARKVLVAYPGMAMMNANGLPAVMTGGIYDDVIKAAGGVNAFAGQTADMTRTLNREQLATAQVDVLVVGLFTPDENAGREAAKLFAAYPHWAASKSRTYTVVSDGVYLGPLNAWAVEKISKVVHPGG
ncbi:ABC transporter substrate-binding protein [Nonomuraea roseoviolacea subsp. roseoviolacea]|uniref:Iron complex transport system substrate-binding protein n=1 Tax=Nonomuraea roseoviolacea subsp. carminata TaxID=160689 RepID=A0ABT1KFT8_9ACTN|nr:ABC transporter substrate-binding protein [Nonomuraea roseoviolacea]MCP2352878.1 iron complex transport system substrate-binding protein [Nonomuraea roseoviolacea subsp. carminata]